jgi:hypothetical protein
MCCNSPISSRRAPIRSLAFGSGQGGGHVWREQIATQLLMPGFGGKADVFEKARIGLQIAIPGH